MPCEPSNLYRVILILLLAAPWLPGQDDSVTIRSSDGTSLVPRLVVTTSTATEHAEIRIENAILRLGTTNNAGTNLAAGDIGHDGGEIKFYDGSSWKTLATLASPVSVILGPGSAQSYSGASTLIHINENGGSAPNLIELEVDGADMFVVQNDGDIFTDRWLGSETNTFIGCEAGGGGGLSNTVGDEGYFNTALGYKTLYSITTGWANTAIGAEALYSLTTGYENTVIGYRAGYSTTNGCQNTLAGFKAGYSLTSGSRNCVAGAEALYSVTTGNDNVALGYRASYNTTGSQTIAVGSYACYEQTTGTGNVAVGYAALRWNQTGTNNTMIGHEVANHGFVASQSGCVFIGKGAGSGETGSNLLYIENSTDAIPLIWGNFATNDLRFKKNLGLGTTSFGTGAEYVLSLGVGTTNPTTSPANVVQLYAVDLAGSAELQVRDEGGNMTTLSPHNFSLLGGPSEPLAWSYHSRRGTTEINVDMLRVVRTVESLCGERLVAIHRGGRPVKEDEPGKGRLPSLRESIEAQRKRLEACEKQLNRLEGGE